LFSFISSNWRVEPLRDYETHRESHCRDHDREGVNRNLLTGSPRVTYRAQGPTEEMNQVNLYPDEFHGEWNYVIKPRCIRT
jgi:hypothetical protein